MWRSRVCEKNKMSESSAEGTCLKNTKMAFATILKVMVKLCTTKIPINMSLRAGHMWFVKIEGKFPRKPMVKKTMWSINVTNAVVPRKPHNCRINECSKATTFRRDARSRQTPRHHCKLWTPYSTWGGREAPDNQWSWRLKTDVLGIDWRSTCKRDNERKKRDGTGCKTNMCFGYWITLTCPAAFPWFATANSQKRMPTTTAPTAPLRK